MYNMYNMTNREDRNIDILCVLICLPLGLPPIPKVNKLINK